MCARTLHEFANTCVQKNYPGYKARRGAAGVIIGTITKVVMEHILLMTILNSLRPKR